MLYELIVLKLSKYWPTVLLESNFPSGCDQPISITKYAKEYSSSASIGEKSFSLDLSCSFNLIDPSLVARNPPYFPCSVRSIEIKERNGWNGSSTLLSSTLASSLSLLRFLKSSAIVTN